MTRPSLILNAGSSSLKFSVYVDGDDLPEASGQVDRIGSRKPGATTVRLRDGAGRPLEVEQGGNLPDHRAALDAALRAMEAHFPGLEIGAVGHRVVHGGTDFTAPVVIDDQIEARLAALTPLAPLHQPHSMAGIRAAREAFPDAMQIACFDTAFHRTMPRVNELYAIPRDYYDAGLRRYGFHGLSYDYISTALRADAPHLAAGRVIVAHLGNGTSLCAMRNGRTVATSMGFSVLEGLVMGTRCGQIDPGVLLYLLEGGMSVTELSDMLYRRSGLMGVSGGLSNDMRSLLESPDPRAAEAVDVFVAALLRGIGAMATTIGGIDGLVFTAGIGENSPVIRERTCAGLEWLGLRLDTQANAANAEVISTPDSTVDVRVIETREDLVILRALREMEVDDLSDRLTRAG